MNVNYLSYFLMLVCTLLAVNIYRLRKNNSKVADQLAAEVKVSIELNENKVRCDNDLISRESAFKDLTEELNQRQKEYEEVLNQRQKEYEEVRNQRQKENEEAKKTLDACKKELTENKAELNNLEEKKEEAEAGLETLMKAAKEDEEDVKETLDACNKELTEKKAELKNLEEKKEIAEAELETLMEAAKEDEKVPEDYGVSS